ncbi:GGDEF domain-containing protein [Pseudodesulfovibrio pelocollis]|uniref:GGDEF domain-containing protein n=1 Tax=Pseudodesulfovibrio pelocollis TaxID=3051432 RepID=UPI00255B3603|nr:GGDEF domain-containing protein [Pseudodesulfovibrio sp. SB368]
MTLDRRCTTMSELEEVLSHFGINDPDWVAVVLFVRNLLARLSIYTDEKKAEIQREILAELAKGDFTDEHLDEIIAMLDMHIMQTIGTLELEEALAQEKRSATELVNEMNGIIDSMQGHGERQNRRLDDFRENTVGVIQSGKDRAHIVARVRGMFQELIVEFREEARELEERARMLEHTANFDPLLTELHNRRALDSHVQAAVLAQAKGLSGPISLMMIDVDHFKLVNDTYGHQAGDDVLHALARIITAHAVQYQGFAARYGGEELVVAVRNMDLDKAVVKAEAIRMNVERYDFRIRTDGRLSETSLQFTVSIGVAQCLPGWDAGRLISAADTAMYQAKSMGRNRVCAYREPR